MKRRAFLVGLAAAPLFIRRAFGDASVGGASVHGPSVGGASIGGAADARVAAKVQPPLNGARRGVRGPTLVLVVPDRRDARAERGSFFGEWLTKASDPELAPLALVDVICGTAGEFGFGGDPLLVFVPAAGPAEALWSRPQNALEACRQFVRRRVPLAPDAAVATLAATARARYVTQHAPRGARWGTSGVCGVTFAEGPPADAVDCGMAFAPAASRRFLDFYVKT